MEWLQQQESLVREAVGVAREEWQEGAEQESRKRVELALKEQQEIWSKRYIILCIVKRTCIGTEFWYSINCV